MRIVALIPARAGSKRIPGKNTKLLGGKPLIQWTIEAAKESRLFDDIYVCTDNIETYDLARALGVSTKSRDGVPDEQPDIIWVKDALIDADCEAFAILRPTSPFRTPQLIREAWEYFQEHQPADSLRAVRRAREHPGKMWMIQRHKTTMVPLLPYWTRTGNDETDAPWHSAPTQQLPVVYVQTSSLEIAWAKTVWDTDTIAGTTVIPAPINETNGFSIDYPEDWARAEQIVAALQAPPAA